MYPVQEQVPSVAAHWRRYHTTIALLKLLADPPVSIFTWVTATFFIDRETWATPRGRVKLTCWHGLFLMPLFDCPDRFEKSVLFEGNDAQFSGGAFSVTYGQEYKLWVSFFFNYRMYRDTSPISGSVGRDIVAYAACGNGRCGAVLRG